MTILPPSPSDGAGQFASKIRDMERRIANVETTRTGMAADWRIEVETFDAHQADVDEIIGLNHEPIIQLKITAPDWAQSSLVVATGLLTALTEPGTEPLLALSISDNPGVTTGPASVSTPDGRGVTLTSVRAFVSNDRPLTFSLDASTSQFPVPPLSATFAGSIIHLRQPPPS